MSSYEARVKRLSVSELNELLEEIETAIKEYSEELVQQLALRDELEFEKEVENSFISTLIEVQNKQKEHKETAKKKKKLKNGSSQNGRNERSHMPGTVSDVCRKPLMLSTSSCRVLSLSPECHWDLASTCFLSSSRKVSQRCLLCSLGVSAPRCAGPVSGRREGAGLCLQAKGTGQRPLLTTSE